MSVIRVKSANLLRRDTAAGWAAANPVLRAGEEGYETDTGRRKVGDGTTEWNNLKYDSGIVDQAYTPDSENAQSGKAVAEAVATEQKRSDNTFANALKAVKSGESLIIDDVSPVTHDMSVKVMSKNLIPFPYYNFPLSEIIVNGLTFITYEDGSILVNGTSEANTQRYLYRNTKDLLGLKTGDTIAFSWALSDNTTDINAYCNYFDSAAAIQSSGMSLSKTITSSTVTITDDWIGFAIYIIFKSGVTYNNLLIKPQLELGTTATAYTPYVPDLTAVKVSRCGKNLLNLQGRTDAQPTGNWPISKYDVGHVIYRGFAYTGYYQKDEIYKCGVELINDMLTIKINTPNYGVGYVVNCSPNTQYTFNASTNLNMAFVFINAKGEKIDYVYNKRFTTPENAEYIIICLYQSTLGTYTVLNPQLEIATTATDYEPYKECAEYTPNADGTVEGVTSLYPNTTLTTDTDGVLIDCEYNRDINKAFAALEAAIATNNS